MIIRVLTLGPIQTNCYIIGCPETREGAVIDPGWSAKTILSEIKTLGLDIKYVLNTHAHWDMVSANAEVVQATGAKLALHALDAPLLRAGGGADLWGIAVKPSPEPDIELYDGQMIQLGTIELQVLHTPGHTPGHVSFYEAEAGVVFTGDTLFKRGVGRYDLPGGSYDDLEHSVNEVLYALPPRTVVYPSHGPATTISEEQGISWFRRTGRLGPLPSAQPKRRGPLPQPLIAWLRQRPWIGAGGGVLVLLALFFLLRGNLSLGATADPTSTASPTAIPPTLTFTPSPTAGANATSTATATATTTATATASPTATATATATKTPTRTLRPTRTHTPTPTVTATGTATPTVTASLEPIFTATSTPSPVPPTNTPAPPPPAATNTPAPPPPTNTPAPPPPTNTPAPPPPTNTPAPPPPTDTPRGTADPLPDS